MLKSNIFRLLICISVLGMFSCVNKKKIIYFQGDKSISSDSTKKNSPTIHTDDLLSITVMSIDAEAAKPFNLSTYGQFAEGKGNFTSSNSKVEGYLVDSNGEIDFPSIGKIKLSGYNRAEAADLIKSKLADYLKNPMVNIQILNFKITILGDVNKPGVYTIPNERITLIEAIGLAGDLNMTALRKNILVIRDTDGKKTETRIDFTSKELFNSSVFYLQQNDVIYVEPNRSKKNSSAINTASISVFVSLTSLVITLITLLTR